MRLILIEAIKILVSFKSMYNIAKCPSDIMTDDSTKYSLLCKKNALKIKNANWN